MGAISVISIPLKTEKWQEDVLDKRLDICRQIYNAMLGYEIKQYRKMVSTNKYKDSKEIIYNAYRNSEDKEKIKKTQEYKDATKSQKELMKEYGFSDYSFRSTAIEFSKHFKGIIPTTLAALSIGVTMWSAFDKLLFGDGKRVTYKRYGSLNSIVTDRKSGIRIVDENNKTIRKMDSSQKYYCLYSSKEGKNLKNHKKQSYYI